jgi:hypothetical protein
MEAENFVTVYMSLPLVPILETDESNPYLSTLFS